MPRKLDEWKDQLEVLVATRLRVPLDQVLDVDERTLTSYWKRGMSPKDYFDDHLSQGRERAEGIDALEFD